MNKCSDTAKKKLKDALSNLFNENFSFKNLTVPYLSEELISLLYSAYISEDIQSQAIEILKKNNKKYEIKIDSDAVKEWINQRLMQNTIILNFDDEDVIELLMFSIEISFSMLEGKTRATQTQKGFRERGRDLETIMINMFSGHIGEVAVKKFIEKKFPNINVKLDRSISNNIKKYKSDIQNAKKSVSIKTTTNATSIWAECPKDYDYGIFVKTIIPKAVLLRAFAHVCGFKTLIEYSKKKISNQDSINIVNKLEERLLYKDCGDLKTNIKCFICGYFKPDKSTLIEKGMELYMIGKINEDRHFIPIGKLKHSKEDWYNFVKDVFY